MKPTLMLPVLYSAPRFGYLGLGALIVKVIDEKTVALTVFNQNGTTYGMEKVAYDPSGLGGTWRYFDDASAGAIPKTAAPADPIV